LLSSGKMIRATLIAGDIRRGDIEETPCSSNQDRELVTLIVMMATITAEGSTTYMNLMSQLSASLLVTRTTMYRAILGIALRIFHSPLM
jgi:hypothetical protein